MVECDICGKTCKNEHGLRIHKSQSHAENGARPKPNDVNLPEGKEWSELSPYQRYYYQHHSDERERAEKRKSELRDWFCDLKDSLSCEICGEDRSVCLDFHHTGQKDKNVSEMVRDGYGRQRIKDEIEKCEVLCANCHRVEHQKT